MKNKSFTTTIEVTNTPKEIFECITKDVAKWWGGKDYLGSSAKINDEFIINHPGAHYSRQKLVEFIPGEKVVWFVTESKLDWLKKDQNEWTHTKMIFEITNIENRTILKFTHEGLSPERECYVACSQGWSMVIKDWLYNYLMEGKAHFK